MKYVGWGGLAQAFDHRNTDWESEFRELSELLTPDEYAAARRSTQDSHYTPEFAVREIYTALEQLGFKGGRILDPALGTGHFIGAMPVEMAAQSKVTGCELDEITARIARQLYPDSMVIQRGYQNLRIPRGHFDAMVGNPPFGNQSVFDAEHPDLSKFSIHNYFIAKSMLSVRRGGVMAFVISRHFMDAASPEVRSFIADEAHFLGAVRLPESAFKASAGVEVTTDIVFL
ncbi:MAG TPA: N-6 DNA methylase, partial [Noviherbaspirillum sp.]